MLVQCCYPGRMAPQSLKSTTSATGRVSFGNPKASLDTQLPAVFIADEIGCLSPMPVSRNPRRSVDFLYGLFTGQKEGEDCIRGSDIEVVMASNQKAGNNDGKSRGRDSQSPGPRMTPRRPSQGPEDGKNRRPSQGPADEHAVSQSSKSIDFSQFQKAMLLSGAKPVARPDSQPEVKKMASKLGTDTCHLILQRLCINRTLLGGPQLVPGQYIFIHCLRHMKYHVNMYMGQV